MPKILLLNGPNLNLLGEREPERYGRTSLKELEEGLRKAAKGEGVELEAFQSNHEGELIDAIHRARDSADAIIFNPGAYTHTSVALRDAVLAAGVPTIEVHITNIYGREDFRRRSLIAPVALGQIAGFGVEGYYLALRAAIGLISQGQAQEGSG